MTDSKTKSESFWIWIGKIALMIGVLWATIQVVNYFSPKEYNLSAYGFYSEYYLPASTIKNLNKTDEYLSPIVAEIPKSLYSFILKNNDTKEILNIYLEVPFEGFFLIVKDKNIQKSSNFQKIIPIGSLRPQNEVKIIVWPKDISSAPGARFNDNFRFTYPDGITRIEFPVFVTGYKGWIVENTFGIILFSLLGIFLICTLMALITGKKTPSKEV